MFKKCRTWWKVLSVQFTSVLEPGLLISLRDWAFVGLNILTHIATIEHNGPFGWMSKLLVYTLSIRMISARIVAS